MLSKSPGPTMLRAVGVLRGGSGCPHGVLAAEMREDVGFWLDCLELVVSDGKSEAILTLGGLLVAASFVSSLDPGTGVELR